MRWFQIISWLNFSVKDDESTVHSWYEQFSNWSKLLTRTEIGSCNRLYHDTVWIAQSKLWSGNDLINSFGQIEISLEYHFVTTVHL